MAELEMEKREKNGPEDTFVPEGDEESSVLRCADTHKKLESAILNSISLGQWEAARAHLCSLVGQPGSREGARELLKILILDSASFWSESPAIPSPHHLSWLALDTYKTLFPNEEDHLPGYVQQLVEFRLLLYSTREITSFSAHIASQICRYHAVHVLRIPRTSPEPVPPLPSLVLLFLHDVTMALSPASGHTLIKSMTVEDDPDYLANNEALQSIYIDCITENLEMLSQLKSPESLETDSSYDSQYESDHATSGMQSVYKQCEKIFTTIYDLLSLVDPSPKMLKLAKKIDKLFHLLLRSKYSIGPERTIVFESGRIYSCLLGRSTPFLINRLHEVEEYLRTNWAAEEGVASRGLETRVLETRRSDRSDSEEWRGLFYEALYNKRHPLESIMDKGLQLVFTGNLSELSQLMSHPEHAPLRPLLLLLGWDRYPTAGSGKDLLDALWPSEVSMSQPLLFSGCCKLAFQVELVQWCLEKARPHLQAPSHLSIRRAGDMFKGLESHSILFVLHHSTPLASLDSLEVVEILKLRPRVPFSYVPITPPPQFSRSATPVKPGYLDSDASPSPSPLPTPHKQFPSLQSTPLRPEQTRDIAIFHSFCTMRLVFDAIWASVQLANGIFPTLVEKSDTLEKEIEKSDSSQSLKSKAISSKVVRKLDLGDTTAEETLHRDDTSPTAEEVLDRSSLHNQCYTQFVTDKLHEAKAFLSLLFPLNYRLEILENIFSLLFLTSDDIKQMKVSGAESEGGTLTRSETPQEASPKPSITRSDSDISTTISSIAMIKSKHGFLVGEGIASDLLDMLQDCIFELRAARYVLSQQVESSDSATLPPSAIKSAISPTSLQKRSTKLEQYINEARWRLQLVSSKHGITAGVPSKMDSPIGPMSSGESASELSESEEELEEKKEKEKRKPKRPSTSGEARQHREEEESSAPQQKPSQPPPKSEQQAAPSFNLRPPTVMSRATLSGKISPSIRPSSPSSLLSTSTPSLGFYRTSSGPPKLSPQLKRRSMKQKGVTVNEKPLEAVPFRAQDAAAAKDKQFKDDSGGDADIDEKSPEHPTKRKRLRSHNSQTTMVKKHRRRVSERMGSGFSKSSIVCQMLASPGSLLRMCLKHSNYLRANEVLKMFEMEGKFGEVFVHFSEQYELVSQELGQRSHSSSPKQSPSLTPGSEMVTPSPVKLASAPPSGAQMNLQVAIMNATNSSVALESLHRLLAPTSINQMLFSGDEQLEKAAQDSVLLKTLVEHVPTLVMLDIVCSSKVDGQVAKRIIELAASRCQPVLEAPHARGDFVHRKPVRASQTHDVPLRGPFPILLTFSDISGYFTFLGTAPPTQGLPPLPHTSPHSLLTTFTQQFRVSTIMNAKMFVDSYQEARERLRQLLAQSQLEGRDGREIITEIAQTTPVEESFSSQRHRHYSGSIFDELVRALKSAPHSSTLPSLSRERSLMRQASTTSLALGLEGVVGVGFLWQFGRYLSKLVELLLRCLGGGSSTHSEATLLLAVLQESPTHTLGRLVFNQGIKPQRLEHMMGDFPHLRIVEVLVKCCCPWIPSQAAVTAPVTETVSPRPSYSAVISLNEGETSGMVTNPCSFSHKLLTKLIATLRDSLTLSRTQEDLLTPEDLINAYNSPEMKKLIAMTPLLATIDMDDLDTPLKQMAFYSNVTNVLYAHAMMVYLVSVTAEEGPRGGNAVHLSMLRENGISMATIQSSQIVQSTFFMKVGYRIGQLGLVSCYDLHHSVLRRGLSPPVLTGKVGSSLNARITPVPPDPWAVHAPSSPYPRLLYVVHDGRVTSPVPVALTPEELVPTLKAAESQYLNATVTINLPKKEVCVPQWLHDHRNDFIKPIWSEHPSDTSHGYLSDLALIRYIHSGLPKEQADILQPLLDASDTTKGRKVTLKLTVRNDSLTFGYNFGMKRLGVKRSPKTSPKARRRSLRKEEKQTSSGGGELPPAAYVFTPETLAFVKQQSLLLAALVHLLCPLPSGKTGSEEEEEEREGGAGKEEGEATGRKTILLSFRARQKPTQQRKVLTFEDKTVSLQPWRKQLEGVLSHFASYPPMRQYLLTRLGSFNSLIPWDSSGTPATKGSRKLSREYSVSLRKMAALPAPSEELGGACSFALRKLLEAGKVNEAVQFLSSEPAASHLQNVQFLSDTAISCAFVTNYCEVLALRQSGESAKPTSSVTYPVALLSQLSDQELAARLALASLYNWPVEICVDILSYCVHHLPPTSPLFPVLSEKLEKMRVYARVMESCESPLPPVSAHWRKARSPWRSWFDLSNDCESRPDYVLRILLGSKAFDLARKWSAVHNLGQSITRQIEVDYMFDLLEGDSPDPIAAQQVLDGLPDNKLTLQVCESVLELCTDHQTTIFMLHYMLTRLVQSIHIARVHDYSNRLLGAKALLCLPVPVRKEYESLVSEPMLLVEQLLIDMKIDWAGSVIRELRKDEHLDSISTSDMPLLDHTPIIISEEEAQDPFTTLLMFYTTKALDFPQPVLTQSTPQPQSLLPSVSSTCPSSPPYIPPLYRYTTPARSIPGERHSTSADPFPIITPHSYSTTRRRISSSSSLMSPNHTSRERFEPQGAPPPRDKWEPNADVQKCRVCKQVYFGMFSRRHHCRRCGRVVCAGCSSRLAPVEGYERPVRVCDNCYPTCVSQSYSSSDDVQLPTADGEDVFDPVLSGLHSFPLRHWRQLLPNDPLYNQNVRREFYYEHTPNTALCLALADLMGDRRVSAAFLLDCCHSVSAQLVPDSHGRVNEEVDHYFVIGLLQNLLLNAKLRFEEAGDSPGVELCDTYLSRVDLLRLLVSSRWTKIPSIQELTKPDLARRVRDRLIQDDRFRLAMEVSTKCQLDTSAVWAAWGVACLNCGDFTTARQKFRHCFQVSSQSKMSSGGQNLQLLSRIVEQIEQNPLSVTGRNTQYSEEWSSVIVGSMALSEKRSEDCDLDIHRFSECTYYLQNYGTPATLVAFFVRHNCWMDACKFILDHNCPTDVFVDHLWVPSLKMGMVEYVQECLKVLDASLGLWEPYLTAACRHFTQRSLYSVLYHTQLFMKDYIRAGMTCIKFFIGFSGRATTIADLFSRLHYLNTARRHFQTSLDAKQRTSERKSGRSKSHRQFEESAQGTGLAAKAMSSSELQNHISTITLQMKVTEFLYHCAEATGTLRVTVPMASGGGAESSSGRHAPQQPATLFSKGHVRAEVAVQLLTCSQDIIEGFELSKEIIQVYRLPAGKIFCDASRVLALRQLYGDIRLILQCIQKSRFSSDALNDEIIMAAIKVLASQTKESKQVDKLVTLLISERSKIKALVQCGKLKTAYLVAIKSRLVEEVQNISEIAEKAGQLPVRDICEKWLLANSTRT